jgi:hypothetical protein
VIELMKAAHEDSEEAGLSVDQIVLLFHFRVDDFVEQLCHTDVLAVRWQENCWLLAEKIRFDWRFA